MEKLDYPLTIVLLNSSQSIFKVLPNKNITIKFADLNKPELQCEDLYSLSLKQTNYF